MEHTLPDLATVADIAKEVPRFPEVSIRDLIYHAEPRMSARGDVIPPNGFGTCIVRVGRRVLIDRKAFAAFLESRRATPMPESARAAA